MLNVSRKRTWSKFFSSFWLLCTLNKIDIKFRGQCYECKLRRLDWLRPEICLESDWNHHLINFYHPNSLSESKLLWQNLFQRLRIPLKSLKSIKIDQKKIRFVQIYSKTIKKVLSFNLFWSFNQLFDLSINIKVIFLSKSG